MALLYIGQRSAKGHSQVTLESSLPKSVTFTSLGDSANVVSSASALLYAGQR